MGGILVVAAVAGEECHFNPLDGPYGQWRRRITVRGNNGDFPRLLEKLIETGTTDDSDHESSPSEPLALEPLALEPLDFESLSLELLDLLLDLEPPDLLLLDFESVT
jgi:hypothetical protein